MSKRPTNPSAWRLRKDPEGEILSQSLTFTDAVGDRLSCVLQPIYGSYSWQLGIYATNKGRKIITFRTVPDRSEAIKAFNAYLAHLDTVLAERSTREA